MLILVAYDPLRLLIGLAVAALLLGVAGWLIATTDWSTPGPREDPFDDDR